MPKAPETAPTETVKLIRAAIADPGRFVPREYEDRDGERIYETIPHWGARAVVAGVLPAVRAAERAKVAEEIEQQFVTEDPETGEVLDETARSVVRYLRGQCGLCGRPYVGGEPCGSPHEIVGRSMARGERP